MTGTVYFSVRDDELRAEDEGGTVRIVVGNFAWTFVLENRLDCARWMKAIADADALFIRRAVPEGIRDAHDVDVPPSVVEDIREALAATERGETQDLGDFLQYADDDDGLEPLPPLPQRTPAGPPPDGLTDSFHHDDDPELLPSRTPALLLDPDCRDGKHTSCAGGPCDCACHEADPNDPYAGEEEPSRAERWGISEEDLQEAEDAADLQPGGTIYPQLTPAALAGQVPLGSLAAGDDTQPEEDEAQA